MDDLKAIKFKVKKILEDFDEMNSSVYLQKKISDTQVNVCGFEIV